MIRRLYIIALLAAVTACAGCSSDNPDGGSDAGPDTDATADADVDATPDAPSPDAERPDADAGTPDADTAPDADDCAPEGEDCDYDGLTDCEEIELGTEVCEHDTDADGLADGAEIANGTDPLEPDTDGDGLSDGDELDFGFDPTKQDTFGDGTLDGDRWVVTACQDPNGEPVNYYRSELVTLTNGQQVDPANWLVGLPPVFSNYTELDVAGISLSEDGTVENRKAAAVYHDPYPEHATAGFLLSNTPDDSQTSTYAVVDGYRDALMALGTVTDENITFQFDTHDFQRANIAHFVVEGVAPGSYEQFRDRLLFAFAPFDASDVSNLPEPSDGQDTSFHVFLSVIEREYDDGEEQLLTSVAVASTPVYDANERVQHRMSDLTSTTNIAETRLDNITRCQVVAPGDLSTNTAFQLAEVPVSSTLRVFVDGRWVPRSRENGYDYFPSHNAIAFFGEYRPQVPEDGEPEFVSVTYDYFGYNYY